MIKSADCENVHIRCESSHISDLVAIYEDPSANPKYIEKYDFKGAAKCLRQKCEYHALAPASEKYLLVDQAIGGVSAFTALAIAMVCCTMLVAAVVTVRHILAPAGRCRDEEVACLSVE